MSEKGIKVLMMGGRRSGKSSMLAGLFDVMLGSDISKLVQVKDISQASNVSLSDKVKDLKDTLQRKCGRVILSDTGATDKFQPYSLQFTIPGTEHSMTITFTDANGEYYAHSASYACEREELKSRVKESDIILIAIDTVYLMEANEGQNDMANCVESVQALLTELEMEDKAKLVVYAPIKCERWSRDGYSLDDVARKVEQVYSTSITALSASPLVEILILPVQTVGNIVFMEQLPAYIYIANGRPLRCSVIGDNDRLRFEDGTIKEVSELQTQNIVEDPTALFQGTNIERPNTWFRVTGTQYKPCNCEQLAYHILRYMLNRAIDAEKANPKKKEEKKNLNPWIKWGLVIAALASGLGWLYAVAAASFVFDDKMGDVSFKEMEDLVNKLSSQGYIKDSGDGIKIVQHYQKLS